RVADESRQRARRSLRLADAAQSAGGALRTGADAHRRAAVRPVAAGRYREGDSGVRSGTEPLERRKGRPHSNSLSDRRATKRAVAARAQAVRRGEKRRATGASRRERAPEEAAERPQD